MRHCSARRGRKRLPDATAGTLLIDARDIDDAEAQISAAFTTFRIRAAAPARSTRIQVWRNYAGSMGVDDVEYTYDLTYDMEAPEQILLCRMLSGVFEETHHGQPTRRHGIGTAIAFGAIQSPSSGRLEKTRYHMISVPREALGQVAGDHPGSDAVRLTSTAPFSDVANQLVVDVADHIRHGLMSNPRAVVEPLVVGNATRYLAASMLAAFPHTGADRPPGETDNYDALRRGTAFIDDNAHRDISPADVAHAARVSGPTLKELFVRHRNCTPLQRLQWVRLEHVHRELAMADPQTSTVADIARKWGFWRLGPFTTVYRETYGQVPDRTLDQ
ncbi:DNA-binding domain-containing protein, AraC-type [Mycolicibacterium gilvum Spyr1]|uniref:DNA-binding domain-containing protein, AraC-type n=1 Tax=Mycolicibacterium gilvum (strain DSM 45189 / LMG 24558 / Spyr1) TaxID=278137 RepID=E6TN79_MYCSR|nr:DNA-binding domain-containing protein, AraC-type [Mycolicibacterium gilvum Spyr1]